MPKVARGRRKRAYRPKTRTGCATCKTRRVKCDETRPFCLRCTSTGRLCDGYTAAEPMQPTSSNIVPMAPEIGPSVDVYESLESSRSFAFFLNRTSPQLAGFFGSEFWERYVLQAAYHESAVRHAIVAIGSLHELIEHRTEVADINGTFALEHYNLAIKGLLVPLSLYGERGIDVCLITCILFICFEPFAANDDADGHRTYEETMSRQGHISKAARSYFAKSHSYVPLDILASIFAGLDQQSTIIIQDYRSDDYSSLFSRAVPDGDHLSFSSIEEAKSVYEYGYCMFINNHVSQRECDPAQAPIDIKSQMGYYSALLLRFLQAIQELVESQRGFLTPKADIAAAVLQLHVLNTYVSLYVEYSPPEDRPSWDTFMPQFIEMVSLGEKIVSFASAGCETGRQPPSFCLDMGYVIPLFTVASQCHEPALRRRAIVLLRSTWRQEGLWNSLVIAQAAERIMEIQETELMATSSNDSPGLWMSPAVRPILQLDGRGVRLQYMRQGQGEGTEVKVVEQVVNWERV
ncbi:putative transcriptional regulatory protein [Seiridium cardinale]|uniref:Transcriptional regulatory protein n=1 Tax=Seiridium cardinale TaxID=138064 RepID=A0ABR2Y523_9PEZI